MNAGLFVFGAFESVRRKMIKPWRVFPAGHAALINHNAQTPKEAVTGTLDPFMRPTQPALDEVMHDAHRPPPERRPTGLPAVRAAPMAGGGSGFPDRRPRAPARLSPGGAPSRAVTCPAGNAMVTV